MDYSNAILTTSPKCTAAPLQCAQNTPALDNYTVSRDHVTTTVRNSLGFHGNYSPTPIINDSGVYEP